MSQLALRELGSTKIGVNQTQNKQTTHSCVRILDGIVVCGFQTGKLRAILDGIVVSRLPDTNMAAQTRTQYLLSVPYIQ
jgi:hypothetical protein